MKNRQPQILQTNDDPQQLFWPLFHEQFKVGMALYHSDLYIGQRFISLHRRIVLGTEVTATRATGR